MKKRISEQPSPWRKSSKRESCYGDRVYFGSCWERLGEVIITPLCVCIMNIITLSYYTIILIIMIVILVILILVIVIIIVIMIVVVVVVVVRIMIFGWERLSDAPSLPRALPHSNKRCCEGLFMCIYIYI